MKVLFISSGNSKLGISPIIKNQGESLRKAGVDVFTEMISHQGRYGPTKYAKYHFIQKAPEEEENKEGDV